METKVRIGEFRIREERLWVRVKGLGTIRQPATWPDRVSNKQSLAWVLASAATFAASGNTRLGIINYGACVLRPSHRSWARVYFSNLSFNHFIVSSCLTVQYQATMERNPKPKFQLIPTERFICYYIPLFQGLFLFFSFHLANVY